MKSNVSVLKSFFWRASQQFSNQLIQFGTQILLARLLLPEEFGLIALITVFITVTRVFVDAGFGQALIQKKDISEKEKSTVFFLNLFIAILGYTIVYFIAPFVADFYSISLLKTVLRVQAIVIVIDSLAVVQNSMLVRNLQFKKSFYINIIGTFVQGVTGVLFALLGFGVWALVFSQISRSIAHTATIWVISQWKLRFQFSLASLKGLSKFGVGILGTGLLNTIFNNINSLLVGWFFSAEILGFYNKGEQLPNLVINTVNEPLKAVLFPVMSKMQSNKTAIKEIMKKIMVLGGFIIFPMMMLLAIIAEPVVILLMTERWLMAVPFVQIACIKLAFSPIHSANLEAIKAIGRSDIFLRLSLIKNIISLVIMLFSVQFGVIVFAFGGVFGSLISLLINILPNHKLINYSVKEQFTDILPNLLLTCIVGLIVYSLQLLSFPTYIEMLLQIIIGSLLYLFLAHAFSFEALKEIKTIVAFYKSESK